MRHSHSMPLHLIRKVLTWLSLIILNFQSFSFDFLCFDTIKHPSCHHSFQECQSSSSRSLCCHCLHCGLRFCGCNFSYHSTLFSFSVSGGSVLVSCLIPHFTPAAVLGSSNKTSKCVVSHRCFFTSVYVSSMTRPGVNVLWLLRELVGVAFQWKIALSEKPNID